MGALQLDMHVMKSNVALDDQKHHSPYSAIHVNCKRTNSTNLLPLQKQTNKKTHTFSSLKWPAKSLFRYYQKMHLNFGTIKYLPYDLLMHLSSDRCDNMHPKYLDHPLKKSSLTVVG